MLNLFSDDGNWIKGLKYVGIVRKLRNKTCIESTESSDIDSHEKRKSLYFSVPIWGILSQNENGTWCHQSTLADIRSGDHVCLNFTAKYINKKNKVMRIVKYFTIDVSHDNRDSSSLYETEPDHYDSELTSRVKSIFTEEDFYYVPQLNTEERNYAEKRAARNDLVIGPKDMYFP